MRASGILFALLMLGMAGCRNGTDATPSAEPTAPASHAPPPTSPPVASLEGAWRVARIDGQSLDEPDGIALTGDAEELWWEPRCAGMARSYRIVGTTISFGPVEIEGRPPAPGSPPPPVCAISVPSRLADVARALDSATRVERTPENGVLISGGGDSVTLVSQ